MTAAVTRAEQVHELRRRLAEMSGPAADPVSGPAAGGLPRGSVAVVSGARSLLVSMVAEATAAGGHAAVVGLPGFGLLAAAERGADLGRLAVVPEAGADPLEVAAVLLDGMDLVVLGLAGRSVPAGRARVIAARARQRGCTLLVTQGHWQGALRIEARVRGYEIATGPGCRPGEPAPGCGRISAVRVTTRILGRR